MNKQPQTYYAIVSSNNPPNDAGFYFTKDTAGNKRLTHFYNKHWHSQTNHPIAKYLSEQQGVVLSVEEWEKVQKCIDALKDYVASDEGAPRSSYINAKQALSQLNTKP